LAIHLVGGAAKKLRNSSATQHVEKIRDKTLKDSFPASDPPASQYFDIPINRQ
jgi:hypothetical protein